MKRGIKTAISLITAVMILVISVGAAFAADEVTITFSSSGVTASSADDVKISGSEVKINASGTYVLTGTGTGSVVVKKGLTGVTLILDNLNLTASATAPITCNKSTEVNIVAKAGTVNTLTDDEYNNDDIYTDETTYPNIENAVIKCKDGSNVTISGTGTININSYGKNGIKGGYDLYEEDEEGNVTDTLLGTSSLTITEATINVTANVNDGIKSDKELNILSGNITVSAADDAIKSDYTLNIGAEGTTGPTINVLKSNEGIEAATMNVYSGDVTVNATDDGLNTANSDLTNYAFSYNQYGGKVYVNVTNGDGIDSNGTLNFYGGTTEIYTPSQGDGEPLDSDSAVNFAGGTVLAVGNNSMGQAVTATQSYVTFGGQTGGMGGMFGGMSGGMSGGSNLVTAGSTIAVKDSSGNTIYSAKAVRNASYVLFTSPELINGSTYTLCNGSSAAATATASTQSSGNQGFGPGGQGGFNPGGQSGSGSSSSSSQGMNALMRFIEWIRNLINRLKALFGM